MAKQTDLLPADLSGRLAFWLNGLRDGDGLRPFGFDDRDLVDTAEAMK